ncbi:MAG: sensor histidine kinase [Bradymonadia bacterium]
MNSRLARIKVAVTTWISVSTGLTALLLSAVAPAATFDTTLSFVLIALGVSFASGLAVWTTHARIGETLESTESERRCAAHTYPFSIMRACFLYGVFAGTSICITQLVRSIELGVAITTGVLTYLITLQLNLVLYLYLRRLLKPDAAITQHKVTDGARQSIRMRMLIMMQVPIVLCGIGIVLVQQASDSQRVEALETVQLELYNTTARRAAMVLPPQSRVQVSEQTLSTPVLSIVPIEPASTLLVLMVLLFSYRTCRAIADDVTEDLRAVASALESIEQDKVSQPTDTTVGLWESAKIWSRFEQANRAFSQQGIQIQRVAEQRREAEIHKARFLAHISHELKSPLNSILGFSELLISGVEGPVSDDQRARIGRIWHSGDTLLRSILALLDISKFDDKLAQLDARAHDGEQLKRRRITLAALADEVRQQYREDPTGDIQLTIHLRPDTTDTDIDVDPQLTARAIALAIGALADCLESGSLRLEVGLENPRLIEIQVVDGVVKTGAVARLEKAWLHDEDSPKDTVTHTVHLTRRLTNLLGQLQDTHAELILDEPYPSLRFLCPAPTRRL